MRSSTRRGYAATVVAIALSIGLFASGCGGDSEAAGPEEILLQPVASPGPDPFTTSASLVMPSPRPDGTARPTASPTDTATPSPSPTVQSLRTVSGSMAGLYGGVRNEPSCDTERLVSLLDADQSKTRAFARAAAITQEAVPSFLRGLTPVVLRADTRVTNHGYSSGAAVAFQSVLQTGTAVLADEYGAPRVRCACGNPLKAPVAVDGAVVYSGRPWPGFRPEKSVVVKPSTQIVSSLIIVDVDNGTWIERRTGTDGEEDQEPDVLPPVDPDDVFDGPQAGTSSAPDGGPAVPDAPGQAAPGSPPPAPSDPVAPPPVAPPPVEPPSDAPVPPENDVTRTGPDEPIAPDAPAQPDLFPG
ncbi:DUF6777 domain-containing protein [Streptomyces sp. MUM 178J]|uniref:DUF6777 domain-containing protein n=1 Tax=Streptomyces sp. MUM 178J TaxID=2791991 RepID=UPI001F03A7D0|nr:DUF6777 domain-containing protein [Streptomyces sp. MUM 178J]WRQ79920.1 DUF6777 domain-containing protein [Streptomyces sp. MUM 178J]